MKKIMLTFEPDTPLTGWVRPTTSFIKIPNRVFNEINYLAEQNFMTLNGLLNFILEEELERMDG